MALRLLVERNGGFVWTPITDSEAEIAKSQEKIVKSLRGLVPLPKEPGKPSLCRCYSHQYLGMVGGMERWIDCGIEYAANRAAEGKQVRFKQWD